MRVFIDHGDRTDRTKARLKYVIDRLGLDKVLALVEEKLGRKLDRVGADALAPDRRSIAPPISACMRRKSPAAIGSASRSRSAS